LFFTKNQGQENVEMLSFLCSDFSFSYIVSKMDKNKMIISNFVGLFGFSV